MPAAAGIVANDNEGCVHAAWCRRSRARRVLRAGCGRNIIKQLGERNGMSQRWAHDGDEEKVG